MHLPSCSSTLYSFEKNSFETVHLGFKKKVFWLTKQEDKPTKNSIEDLCCYTQGSNTCILVSRLSIRSIFFPASMYFEES